MRFGRITLLVLLSWFSKVKSQSREIDLQFGMNVTRPRQIGDPYRKAGWSHNFWMGVSQSKSLGSGSYLHNALLLNFVNYRFSSADSPKTFYSSLTYFSIPIQLEYKLTNKTGLLIGAEPKCHVGGFQFTAEPGKFSKIRYFKGQDIAYIPLNLGFRLGFIYHSGPIKYFFQASSDMFPFRRLGGAEWFDNKIIFGFTLAKLYRK